jgi:hypothetical protein
MNFLFLFHSLKYRLTFHFIQPRFSDSFSKVYLWFIYLLQTIKDWACFRFYLFISLIILLTFIHIFRVKHLTPTFRIVSPHNRKDDNFYKCLPVTVAVLRALNPCYDWGDCVLVFLFTSLRSPIMSVLTSKYQKRFDDNII